MITEKSPYVLSPTFSDYGDTVGFAIFRAAVEIMHLVY
jgi:hypothetical protein